MRGVARGSSNEGAGGGGGGGCRYVCDSYAVVSAAVRCLAGVGGRVTRCKLCTCGRSPLQLVRETCEALRSEPVRLGSESRVCIVTWVASVKSLFVGHTRLTVEGVCPHTRARNLPTRESPRAPWRCSESPQR